MYIIYVRLSMTGYNFVGFRCTLATKESPLNEAEGSNSVQLTKENSAQ